MFGQDEAQLPALGIDNTGRVGMPVPPYELSYKVLDRECPVDLWGCSGVKAVELKAVQ